MKDDKKSIRLRLGENHSKREVGAAYAKNKLRVFKKQKEIMWGLTNPHIMT